MTMRAVALCLVLAWPLAAQHIRVKVAEPAPDFSRIATYQLRAGTFTGRHYKVDEAELRRNLEAKIAERAAAQGLRPTTAKPDVVIAYNLRAEEEKERPGRGSTRTRPREVMRYELQIRLLDAATNQALWTATGTGEADDWRHKYLEERVLRAVVFAFAKYPPAAP
ncbi:MAG: DUF4136 domain-containing protein [Bryobacterales bacterium]|nr:DUF4136 domain-containing protein [Bryobacterales bacterium]